jgi:hypothetical protein
MKALQSQADSTKSSLSACVTGGRGILRVKNSRALQKVAVAVYALCVSVFMVSGCQSSEDWEKGVKLLEARGLDPMLLPDSTPRDFYQITKNPESPEHVSEQLVVLRRAQAGAKIFVANGYEREKIRGLSLGDLLDAHKTRLPRPRY